MSRAGGDIKNSGGGLVFWNNGGNIFQSFATTTMEGAGGGFVWNEDGTIADSYATGVVNDGGGFAFEGDTTISTSYSTGAVPSGWGGFACNDDGDTFSDDYWDTTTSGTQYGACYSQNFPGLTGLTSQQLQSGLPAGFDHRIWAENPRINGGLPYLINNPPEKK
jgi:hypothetical protein